VTRVGLVLGAGGLVGEAYHRGVLRALADSAGWDARTAEIVIGTSAGSLVAASIRVPPGRPPGSAVPHDHAPTGPAPSVRRLGGLATLGAVARRPWRARATTLASSLLPAGTHSLDVVVESVRHRHGTAWPDRTTWIPAVRWADGRRVVFGRAGAPTTDLGTAVAASCAVPGWFRPVVVDGVAYVDGGVHSPTNADLLAGEGLDLVVISSSMSVPPSALRPRLDVSLRLLWHRYLMGEVLRLRRAGTKVLVFEPSSEVLHHLTWNPVEARSLDVVEDTSYDAATRTLRHPRSRVLRAALSADLLSNSG
jgi:NTE family protein